MAFAHARVSKLSFPLTYNYNYCININIIILPSVLPPPPPPPPPRQSLVVSLSYEAVEWDVSSKKQQLLLLKKDKSLHILVHTKMVRLITSPTFSALSNPFIIFFLSVIIIIIIIHLPHPT